MSEQADVWQVRVGGTTRWCRKYGLTVSGCAHHFDCKDCKVPENEAFNEPKRPKKTRKKPSTSNIIDPIIVKKRDRKNRNGSLDRSKSDGKPAKIPKAKAKRKVRRRSKSSRQQKLMT